VLVPLSDVTKTTSPARWRLQSGSLTREETGPVLDASGQAASRACLSPNGQWLAVSLEARVALLNAADLSLKAVFETPAGDARHGAASRVDWGRCNSSPKPSPLPAFPQWKPARSRMWATC
jgi:hypothetical protein